MFSSSYSTSQAAAKEYATGAPLFISIHTLETLQQSLQTDLESLFNVLLFICSKGKLPWRNLGFDDPLLLPARSGCLTRECPAVLRLIDDGEKQKLCRSRLPLDAW